MMKNNVWVMQFIGINVIVWVAVYGSLSLVDDAFGQIGNFQISAPQIQDPPKCSSVDISGDKAYLPFQIKMFHEFSRVNDITFEQLGNSIPQTHTSPELLIFETLAIDSYQIHTEVNHDSDKVRAVYIEIWSQNNPSFKEIISYEGLSFCRTFNVQTSEAPKIPTRTELIGEQAERAFEEMPLIKNAINSNTSALSSALSWMFLVVVAALGVSAGQFFAYVGRRRKDKKRGTSFDNMIKVGSKYISEFKKEHEQIKNQRIEEKKQMNSFLDMANIELRSFLQDLRKGGSLPERASLQPESKSIEEDAEQTSILRKVYESTSDENLMKFINFFKDKTGRLAKRHQDLLDDEAKKRDTDEKPEEEPKESKEYYDETIPIDKANSIIKEYGAERYRKLTTDQLRLLYRAFDAKYRDDAQTKYANRLFKINEIINKRAKQQVNGEKKK